MKTTAATFAIEGHCDAAFAALAQALELNMAAGQEVGCAVAVVIDGETVVDLWAGHRDRARSQPWTADTITDMKSVGKSIYTLNILRLVGLGQMQLDAPVAQYWPAFGQAGKESITVRLLLGHLAGLPYPDAAPLGSLYQPGVVNKALEAQAPEWPPGTQACYHSFTFPLLCAELLRQATGRSARDLHRDGIARPLGAEYWLGLEDAQHGLCADYLETPGTPSLEGMKRNPDSPLYRAWRPLPREEDYNSADWRRYAGHGNARGMARIYAALACGGTLDGYEVVHRDVLAEATQQGGWEGMDYMTKRPFSMGLGFMRAGPAFSIGQGKRNFGHPGMGGAIAFADPDRRMSFSYCPNRMSPVADTGPWASALIHATYASLA
ncbi:CubicO group peptidase, beta-lactamase class C family [Polaromonas sp. OV174]|uniref:serine hydrolase domain-containing protein n=1 Tax=Polaromonas sp. OV174 TaxID=1855300 RepID=UPI0008DEF4D5|nr:serine hydrolase domain-containing protein [Polaromonas sp. OV174]SFB78347.1 CubicO group peptidase, beta-lactamase class C family [Polaromonas sp. OV174]